MRRTKLLIGLLALTVFTTGCYKIRYTTRLQPSATVADESWHHNVVFGLIELTPPVEVNKICPQGVAVVQNEITLLNALPGIVVPLAANLTSYALNAPPIGYVGIVGSLWNPSTVRVTCGGSKAQMTPLRPEPPAPSPFEVALRSR